tara:strand:- start:800 stop:1630 length:831 start_codon:yes stop_codon:yes gene_type:complete
MAPDDISQHDTTCAEPLHPATQPEDLDCLIEEAEALAIFIARRGDIVGDDDVRAEAFKNLRAAIAAAKSGAPDSEWALLDAYSRVSAFTYADSGVNGRTILDTHGSGLLSARILAIGKTGPKAALRRLFKPRCRPLLLGGTLLFLVAVFEGILLITGGKPSLEELHETLLAAKVLMLPLVWGALGTCTFLMKRLSDKLSAFAFEEARARGMGTRVFLGAILGMIVVEIIGTELGQFPKYLIAFMAGLGVKPVYAAIEGMVEGIAARIKLPGDTKKS